MSAVTFDTLQFVETLEEAGIPGNQARAIAKAVRDAYSTARPATKADPRETVPRLPAPFRETQSNLPAFRNEMRSDLPTLRVAPPSGFPRSDTAFDRLDTTFDRVLWQLTVRLGTLFVFALGALMMLLKWCA